MKERKRAAPVRADDTLQALRDSEERYRRLVELCPDGLFIHCEGRIAFINLTGTRMLGAERPQQIVGMPALDIIHPDFRGLERARLAQLDAGKQVQPLEEKMVRLDGGVIDVEVAAAPLSYQGRPAAQVVVRDITARKEAEESLRRQTDFIRAITESMGEGLYAIDRSGRVTFMNPAAEKILGWLRQEILLRDLHQMTHYRRADGTTMPRQECAILTAMESRTSIRQDDEFIRKDGSVLPVTYMASPLLSADGEIGGAVLVFHDASERRMLEEQLLHSQKLEAVGRLAGGIAHDFNNLLSVVSGYGEMVLADTPEPARKRILEILRAADRATTLTRQLLAFGRKQVIEPKMLDLNAVVTDVSRMLHRLIGEDIELASRLSPDLGRIKADAGQVEQVIINLVVNARDAMPEGGKLTVETTNVDLDDDAVRGYVDVRPGPYVRLAVSDTGVGMDREVREHLFEPFFTTKGAGKGSGLGLATVYGIVKQGGGHIWIYSEPGWGTTFKIFFPRVADGVGSFSTRPPEERAVGGTETVLVVEDDEMLRSLIREILGSAGYQVLLAETPDAGMALLSERSGGVDLLLTDVVLPGMSGRELVERVGALHPEMKVLFMSGYTDEAVARHGVLEPGLAFLQKPFSRDAIIRKVRQVLDTATSRSP
jgi:PAS domain S-box-containing protein